MENNTNGREKKKFNCRHSFVTKKATGYIFLLHLLTQHFFFFLTTQQDVGNYFRFIC